MVSARQNVRRQATLFLKGVRQIEKVRHEFNPEQERLIAPHMTLCREDEVLDWAGLTERLKRLEATSFTLDFGMPVREGNLLYVPCAGSTAAFDRFRTELLGLSVRKHNPHITLIHPRNGVCTDAISKIVTSTFRPFSYAFDEVAFIRQENGGVWDVLERFKLLGDNVSAS